MLLLTGYMNDASIREHYICKLDSSGVADISFGNSGITLTSINPVNVGYDLLMGGDGKIYSCGTIGIGGQNPRDFLLLRLLADGSPDLTFNGTGYLTTTIRQDWDEANGMCLQADGKIVLAGFSSGISTSGDNDLVITRYLNDYVPPPSLVVNFIADDTTLCAGNFINFTDQSTGNITTWNWTFEGGTPSTSSVQNPVVTYENAGTYDVRLIGSNDTETDTLLREDYIQIFATPTPDITGEQTVCKGSEEVYETQNNSGNSFTWEVTGGEIILGTGTYQITVLWGNPGEGSVIVTEETGEDCTATTENYMITIEECTFADEYSLTNISIYPNPAKNIVYIKGCDIQKLVMLDHSGKVVYENFNPLQNNKIGIYHLKAGIYLLKIETSNGLKIEKVVIE